MSRVRKSTILLVLLGVALAVGLVVWLGAGKIGDGKIFIMDLERVVRIRTGEVDVAAL